MRTRVFFFLALVFLLRVSARDVPAQNAPPVAATPEDNPTGNTGALKAQIQTGGSYDAHSSNATRMVNDLHVPDALGAYGLDFTRYWNSVHCDYDEPHAEWPLDFGMSGWSHSWHWVAAYVEHSEGGENASEEIFHTDIIITFPDGHTTKYHITRSNRPHGIPGSEVPADGRSGPPLF